MLRLYVRLYIALLASVSLFGMSIAVLWHMTGGSMERTGNTIGRLVQNALPPAESSPSTQQAALQRLAAGLNGDVTLIGADGRVIAAIGHPLRPPAGLHPGPLSLANWGPNPVSMVRLTDGRIVVASVPLGMGNARTMFHVMLVMMAAIIGLAAFPVVRQLMRRLERLQRGVELLGAGDLTVRVRVEGRDEVARLAESFNRAAGQIEQLVRAHQALLANASHELRTPLARIRLAVELLKSSADARTKAGLDQDIAELDRLVDEILLASRLEAVTDVEVTEEVDLLAVAAEECSHYDDVQLEGTATIIRGDPRLLRRLLRNLLENAGRHGVPPTQVRVMREGATAVVKVWDSGPGPPQSDFENVFKPFYRRRESGNSTGAGLGLALVRQIARRHGGDALCVTMEDGRTSFVVTLAG